MPWEAASGILVPPGTAGKVLKLQLDESGVTDGATAQVDGASELFRRHSAAVYRYCLRRLGSPEDAEDALQATYLNAWRSLKRGFEPEQPAPWLFRIAANVCATELSSKLGGTRLELRDPTRLDELAGLEDSGSEELLGLSEALRELPARQRRALVLRDWRGLSYHEIAAEMTVSDAAVETLLFRARNNVASALIASDWRKRLAAASRALLIWPFELLRPKTAAATGADHLKIGLALGGGAVAPLVAFGLIHGLLTEPKEGREPTRGAAVSHLERAQPPGPWPQEELLLHSSIPRAGILEATVRRQAGALRLHASRKAPAGKPQPTTQAPSSAGSRPAVARESKIVLCHGTQSEKRPGVTISVSKHALAGLGRDSAGACG